MVPLMHRSIFIGLYSVLWLTTVIADEPSCSQYGRGWHYFDDKCYLIYTTTPATTDWYDAENYCQKQGGHLLSVTSQKEDDFITTELRSNWGYAAALWIGINMRSNASYWSDGLPINIDKVKDGMIDPPLGQKSCVLIQRYEGTWLQTHCSEKLNFICKRPHSKEIPPTPPPVQRPVSCPPDYIKYESKLDSTVKCFKFFGLNVNDRANWSTAFENCRTKHGPGSNDLLSIHSEEEQLFLTSILPSLNTSLWIGLKRINFVDFGWSNNRKVDYVDWAPNEPTGVWQQCVEMMTNDIRGGKWADTTCSAEQAYICEHQPDKGTIYPEPTPAPNTCSKGYLSHKEACYKIAPSNSEESGLTWSEAEKSCQQDGGHLVSINNPFEQGFIFSSIITLPSQPKSLKFWVGLTDKDSNGVLQWVDKWPAYYADWAPNEPKLSSSSPRCIFIDAKTKLWSVTDCGERLGHICKVTSEKPPVVPELVKGDCPPQTSNWIDVGGDHCYLITTRGQSWGNAYLNCTFYGAALASFHSQHEVNLLSSYIKKASQGMYIGLHRDFQGHFKWKDGTPLDYVNWGEIRLENIWQKKEIESGNCAEILSADMKWGHNDCSSSTGFICKIEKLVRK